MQADEICGQSDCATVSWSWTITGGVAPYTLTACNFYSPSELTVGSHTIFCTVRDSLGDTSPPASFTITVTPGGPPPPPPPPPPSLPSLTPPADITVQADEICGQSDCATVSWSWTITGGVAPYTLTACNFYSPSELTVGSHTIFCTVRDSVGDSSPPASFTVTVTPPAPSGGGGSTSGSGGTSTGGSTGSGGTGGGGTGGGGGSSSSSSSGGSSTSSSSGNGSGSGSGSGSSSSAPAGADTTPPTIDRHPNIRVFATSPAGAVVAYEITVTDPDNTGAQLAVSCLPASSSTFPLGPHGRTKTTTVTCHAHDPAGNTATPRSFVVTVLGLQTRTLKHPTRTSGCRVGPEPDRRCSPGAYYSKLTKAVVCAPTFRTGTVGRVTQSEKHAVEVEYGLAPRDYGRALEIDHIVSLELGGSNDIANLYPEEAGFAGNAPGYRVKDKLESRLHEMVCAGQIGLHAAQREIASDWEALYRKLYGVAMLHVTPPKPVVLGVKNLPLRLTVRATRATRLTLTLLDRKGHRLARWHERARRGENAYTLLLPRDARHPGHDRLRVSATGDPTAITRAVTLTGT